MDNKHKIINYLGKHQKSFTMHELSRLLNIPYASFHRTIQDMNDLITIKTIGKSKTIGLNTKNPIVKAHLIISSDEEKKEFLEKQPIIRKISNEIKAKDIVLLFGSYAKGKETEKSDIDLLIINKDGKKSISLSKHELLYQKKINPIFLTRKEFKNMLKDKEENVANRLYRTTSYLTIQKNSGEMS